MATAVRSVKRIRRTNVRMVVVHGGKELPAEQGSALLAELSDRRLARERREQVETLARRPGTGDSASVRFAMRCIEQRIVKGLWVLELTLPTDGPAQARRNGLGYIPDDIDHWGQAVANGGWQPPPPRPAIPSGREIDAAKEAQQWIKWLDEGQARLLTAAAMTKRGDRERRVNWEWVKARLCLPERTPHRTLQDRYDRALRWIVAELTVASGELLAG